eukprot:10562135-Ditylum_brightwellii.AAC.1
MHDDQVLQKRLVLSDPEPVTQNFIRVGSEIHVEDQKIVVTAINEEGCGTVCLTVDSEYIGFKTCGMKASLHSFAAGYSFEQNGLAPETPLSLAPLSVPAGVPGVWVTPISETELQIDFEPPLNENSEGSNSAPVT